MTKAALEAAYKDLLQRSRLSPDRYQLALVSRLARLQSDLVKSHNAVSLPGQKLFGPRGLYIYGSVGTGKSRIADLFASTLPTQISKRRSHFYEFMMDIHSRLHTARQRSSYSGDPLIEIGKTIVKESKVLCFDEFQVTDIADALILSRLFHSIWQEGGVMVSTSNRHPDKLYENGLNRDLFLPFIGELKKCCEIWEIGGKEDYRMKRIAEAERLETFFLDYGAFRAMIADVLGHRQLQLTSIPVYGSRRLSLNAAGPGREGKRFVAVSGTFQDLCEDSLGSSDYHSLASSTDMIFVSGLRTFLNGEKDSVRRFITMIDLAYEAKTRVVCLSTVPLSEVFINIVPTEGPVKEGFDQMMRVKKEGGSSSSMMSTFIGETEWSATGLSDASLATGGAGETDVGFAVGRAVSRLYEMSSADYGVRD